jgi:2',3'-cyclic-nucleotide 2'-phosphodiesterase (5'-nucleotidase family)
VNWSIGRRFFFILFLDFIACFAFSQNAGTLSEERRLTILYTNDLHAHLEPQKIDWIDSVRTIGGFANIATLVKNEKAKNPNTLYLDAGDFFTGPYICSLTKGEAVIDVMNHMSIDAACAGNHEFDYGWQNMVDQFKKAEFPLLCGNVFIQGSNNLLWNHPYRIIVKNGLRIGVIGLHGKFAFYDTVSSEMTKGVEARDEEIFLRKYLEELKGKTDLVVLLVHEGIPGRQSSKGTADVARNLQKDIDLAGRTGGVDILISGHAHQGTSKALVSNGTLIVSTDALGIELGRLDIVYNPQTDKISSYTNKLEYLFDDEVEDDPETLEAINRWKEKLSGIIGEKVCSLSGPLSRSYGEESTLGNMVADAMLHACPGYDFAVINSGGLRQDIEAGVVTFGNLVSAFPFPNTVVKLEMKGSDIIKVFEHSAGQTNGILQISRGAVLRLDEKLPIGGRVVSFTINGSEIEREKIYKLLAPNFLAGGGDGFLAFRNAISAFDTHEPVVQPMLKYMKSFELYIPKLESRIIKQ